MQYIHYSREAYKFFPQDLEAINLTPWKARQINRFVYPVIGKKVKFLKRFKSKMKNIIVWGKNTRNEGYINQVDDFISVEDGFIRSVGLGDHLHRLCDERYSL